MTPETTGSGHAREKRRPRNGNQRPFVSKGVLKLEIISVHPKILHRTQINSSENTCSDCKIKHMIKGNFF